jgi:hypothetical protein
MCNVQIYLIAQIGVEISTIKKSIQALFILWAISCSQFRTEPYVKRFHCFGPGNIFEIHPVSVLRIYQSIKYLNKNRKLHCFIDFPVFLLNHEVYTRILAYSILFGPAYSGTLYFRNVGNTAYFQAMQIPDRRIHNINPFSY